MNKQEFLEKIRNQLEGLSEEDIERSIDYYAEMIEDRVEDGLTEEDAVDAIGSPEEVVSQIFTDTSIVKLVKAKVKPKKHLSVWTIILIILGSPLWLPIMLAIAIVILSIYIVLWSVILVLYSVDFSFAVTAVAGLVTGAVYMFHFSIFGGLFVIGIAITCAGLAVLTFFGSNQATKGLFFISKKISKKIILGIKSCFLRRSEI